jgi:hypothetical protein
VSRKQSKPQLLHRPSPCSPTTLLKLAPVCCIYILGRGDTERERDSLKIVGQGWDGGWEERDWRDKEMNNQLGMVSIRQQCVIWDWICKYERRIRSFIYIFNSEITCW